MTKTEKKQDAERSARSRGAEREASELEAKRRKTRSSDSQQTPALPEIDPHGVCVEVKGSARVRPEGIGCRRQEGEDRRREGSFSPFLSRPASRRKAAVSLPGDDAALFPPFSPVACMQREKDSFFSTFQKNAQSSPKRRSPSGS
ncbi:hypothetical protein TGVEG_300300 [Toxoplasma gondii VEG]|uniref:Uncharacterized protein n=1 Tax=Toxoplasma gondii (strain ATCC 50861 / VEG) TaxID=432359 RepID=V4Z355_TOXGV|nr:hypothetical protein TGVEG_300300 [Toxoplasma gondii VEG]